MPKPYTQIYMHVGVAVYGPAGNYSRGEKEKNYSRALSRSSSDVREHAAPLGLT